MGLKKRISIERKRKKTIIIKKRLAQRLQKTLQEIEKLEEDKELEPTQGVKKTKTVPAVPMAAPFDTEVAQDIVFQPNAGPQTEFLSSSEREVLYGGAAGGGKSYAMLADPLHGLNSPNFSGLLVRHTTEELRELIQKSQELYPRAVPGIKWSERKSQWTSPRGGDFGCRTSTKIWMLHVIRVKRLIGLALTS